MFDSVHMNMNAKEKLGQKPAPIAMEDSGDAQNNSMTKNRRVVVNTTKELNLTSTNIINDIGGDLGPIVGYAQEPLLPLFKACAPLIDIVHNLSFYIEMALYETPEEPSDGLTIDESAAIRLYTIEWDEPHPSLYSMLNHALMNDHREHLRPYFKYMKLFLTALAKLPCVPLLTIWRGAAKNMSEEFLPGTPVIWWAVSSCTTSLTVLENNMYLGETGDRTLFSIEAINGRKIRAHSHFVTEEEVLLLPGTHMIVQSQLNPAPNLHIIHLKQVIPEEMLVEPPFEGAYLYPKTKRRQWYRKKRSIIPISLLTAILIAAVIVGSVLGRRSPTMHQVDYAKVKTSIAALMDDNNYVDGNYGPLFVRLGWLASGTYSRFDSTGGSNGGCIRFEPQSTWPVNKGLSIARDRLQSVYHDHPGLTYADLYTLAAVMAIEQMGGPTVKWRHGRVDYEDGKKSPPANRLPSASQGAQNIREIFSRMGFNDRETVALIGAHSVGRCHTDRSGFEGQWTSTPTTFSNEFFRHLLEDTWQERHWQGPKQFEDVKTKSLMRLPSDMALIQDPEFKIYVIEYANNGSRFALDFADAFEKLLELGVDFPSSY
ncbi:unnamed protein product [Rotaria sordida]|uniref:Cytochrome c peroxidase, mitochondrial n=2 Tax=Rotaria sordida TaxID=392033 RepID=A0A814LTZ9_9BILA|nr:unnamed protein product [Rotaria sordida]